MEHREKKWRILRSVLRNRTSVFGGVLFLAIVLVAVFAPFLAPYDPTYMDVGNRLSGPSKLHPLGTDNFGRDILSRVIYGARTSLSVGVLSVFVAMAIGTLLGSFAAYQGGLLDVVVTEFANILLSFPDVFFGLLILTIFGSGFAQLVAALSLAYLGRFIRLGRASTLSVKEREYVEWARAIGLSPEIIVFKHIVPNILDEILVAATLWVGAAILAQAALSFLGLGLPPPTPTWGSMIREGLDYLLQAPWMSLFPGVATFLSVVALNMLGDGLRDLIDPRTLS